MNNDILARLLQKPDNEETPLMLQNPAVEEMPSRAIASVPVQAPSVSPEQQTAAGLMGNLMVPREANYQAPQISLPAVDPEVAKARAAQEKAVLDKLSGLDENYKKNLEEANKKKFRSEIFAALGNYLPHAIAGATAMNTKTAVKAPDLPKITAEDHTADVKSKYKTDYENLLSQYKTMKDSGLSAKDMLYANIANAQLSQGAERINANKENTDRNAGIRVGAAILKDEKGNELSDKQVEADSDLANSLSEIDKVIGQADKFKDKLGPNAASYEALKEGRFGAVVPGKIDPEFVKFRSSVKALRGQYQKIISGLTVSDAERKDLESYIPNENMPYDTFVAASADFKRRLGELRKNTNKNLKSKQGKNVEGYAQPTDSKPVSAGPYGDTYTKDNKNYKWNAQAGKYQLAN